MQASDRLGGHIVQGHVDGVGEVVSVERGRLRPAPPRRASAPSCCATRSTRARSRSTASASRSPTLGEDWVEVSLIPETLERTNLGEAEPGRRLNVECDVVAKYVERLVAPFAGKERA